MSLRFAVVHEAEADFRTATDLADRVLVEAIDWLEETPFDSQRKWLRNSSGGQPLTWKAIKHLARDAGIRAHGHFDGQAGQPDAVAARRAILFLRREYSDLAAIVLIRDQDDQPSRRQGLEQAANEAHAGVPIVIGLAIVERECWVISGFECDAGEMVLLDEIK
jgi:hypothetical protein